MLIGMLQNLFIRDTRLHFDHGEYVMPFDTQMLDNRLIHASADPGLVKCKYLLAMAGRRNRRRDRRRLKVAQDAGNHRFLGNGRNDAQRATAAKRADRHIQIKYAP